MDTTAQQVDIEALRKSGQIRAFLDLSSSHLTAEERHWLSMNANPGSLTNEITVMEGTFGWFIHCSEDRDTDTISDNLWNIMCFARGLGCEYLLFDVDAPIIDGLPQFPDPEEPGN